MSTWFSSSKEGIFKRKRGHLELSPTNCKDREHRDMAQCRWFELDSVHSVNRLSSQQHIQNGCQVTQNVICIFHSSSERSSSFEPCFPAVCQKLELCGS